MTNETTFTLYRFYTAEDALLYVGLTINPGRRMEKHRADKPWWNEVSRITMEHLPSLAELRRAERSAIETEKPLHNIRMNGESQAQPLGEPPNQEPAVSDGLVGRWFHSWRPVTDDEDRRTLTMRGDRALQWQGRVVDHITDGLYLVETVSWWDGCSYDKTLTALEDMKTWTFYVNHIEMQAALGCRESRGDWTCRGPGEYITMAGASCTHCAGYYSEARRIIWNKDGVPSLGPKTRVPHPLSDAGSRLQ